MMNDANDNKIYNFNDDFFNQSNNNTLNNENVNNDVLKKETKFNTNDNLENQKKENFISFRNVKKVYCVGETDVLALDDISFDIKKGELVVMLGTSGAGKSTALNALGGMDTITSGKIIVDNVVISDKKLEDLTEYRRNDIGFVFQFYNLLHNLTALENVELVKEISQNPKNSKEILNKVGLGDRLKNFPSQMSGGEQQRASIARAIVKNPKILLCDEPTGALDYKTGKQILKLLYDICKNEGITVIIITHNSLIAPIADRVISFRSGKITNIVENSNPTPVEEIEW